MSQNVEIAKRLISYAIRGGPFAPISKFPRSGHGITIPVENIDQYFNAVREFFALERDVMHSYSIKTFEKKVFAFIAPFVISSEIPERKQVQDFLLGLKSVRVQPHDVYRPVYGIEIEEGVAPVELGPFTIYNTHRHAAELDVVMNGRRETALMDKSEHYLIRTTVETRDDLRAQELGDEKFEQFEGVVRCVLGPGTGYDVSVSHSLEPADLRSIVLNSASGLTEIRRAPSIPIFCINDPLFVSTERGFDRLWGLAGASVKNEFNQKVLLAVDWIGQSIAEKVPSSAFIKAAIALEVLFSPKKEFISSSITAQISESAAMLLGTDADSRLKTEKVVKDLYGIRSKVAHEGRPDVDYADLFAVQDVARNVIIKLLTSESLKTVETGQALQQYLKAQKYSCPAII